MDNSPNNLLDSLKNSITAPSENIISSSSEPSSNAFFSWFQNISILTWILIIFILAFLGINIFSYLSQGTQEVTNIFQPLINGITSLFKNLTGQVANVAAEGGKGVVNATAGVANAGLTGVQQISQGNAPSATMASTTNNGVPIQNTTQSQSTSQINALNTALNSSSNPPSLSNENEDQNYQADDANSAIQSATSGKAGWCYIGEENGIRTCGEVGVNDTCMSGDIFPSQQICINPSLRA